MPASEKLVSLFEPHADIIVKGSRRVQYGHKLNPGDRQKLTDPRERPRLPVGLAVGATDQAPRACDSARGLTGKERATSRFRGSGTEGSNPALSTGESVANLTPWSRTLRGT